MTHGATGPAADPVGEVLALLAARGHEHHGEVIDQRAHALQCATLALADGASDPLVAAALLHDIGHLVAAADGVARTDLAVDDDRHEAVGARWLAPRFGPTVARAVALHVVAKRYRCTVDPDYAATLSPTSGATLAAQGGVLSEEDADRFGRHPGAGDALRLRAWDEDAKVPDRSTPGIDTFVPLLTRVAVSRR